MLLCSEYDDVLHLSKIEIKSFVKADLKLKVTSTVIFWRKEKVVEVVIDTFSGLSNLFPENYKVTHLLSVLRFSGIVAKVSPTNPELPPSCCRIVVLSCCRFVVLSCCSSSSAFSRDSR